MTTAAPTSFQPLLDARLRGPERAGWIETFRAQDEFLVVEDFLTGEGLAPFLEALPALEPHVNRNYLPNHKQGGSVSRYTLDEVAPVFAELYAHEGFRAFLKELTGRETLQACPPSDPHTYALYYYTQKGDHIAWHYDTSYYRGERYTILLGLEDRSDCRLEVELYTNTKEREREALSLALSPGMFVVFNGDKVHHRVTPASEGDRRVALTLEYVTDPSMHPWRRFVSNMKDALAYFGFKQVFFGK